MLQACLYRLFPLALLTLNWCFILLFVVYPLIFLLEEIWGEWCIASARCWGFCNIIYHQWNHSSKKLWNNMQWYDWKLKPVSCKNWKKEKVGCILEHYGCSSVGLHGLFAFTYIFLLSWSWSDAICLTWTSPKETKSNPDLWVLADRITWIGDQVQSGPL